MTLGLILKTVDLFSGTPDEILAEVAMLLEEVELLCGVSEEAAHDLDFQVDAGPEVEGVLHHQQVLLPGVEVELEGVERPRLERDVAAGEKISEAEVVHAIRNGHITMDAIKFATRAGMGRCQGGFCGIPVINYLSRSQGVDPGQVTKKGSGSDQVVGAAKNA